MALRLIIPPTYGKYKKNAQMMYVFGTGRIVMLPVPKGASYRLYPTDFLRSSNREYLSDTREFTDR